MNILEKLLNLDYRVGDQMLFWRTDFWNKFFYYFTKLGSWYAILIIFIIILAIYLIYHLMDLERWAKKKNRLIVPFFICLLGTGLTTVVIKYLVGRARPGLDLALFLENGPSFPSAHSALILALFGFLIYCLWKFDFISQFNYILKIIISLIFVLIILLIGLSRLYLGVHFLSDVLGGYLIGLMWVFISMYLSRKR